MSTVKVLIGFLLLGALIIFALATFYIENWQFYVQEGYRLNARFSRALELKAGDEVRIAGVEVGRVHSISVDPRLEKPVKVNLWIRKDTDIREADVAHVRMRSIFGGSFLEIVRIDQDARVLGDGDSIEETRSGRGVAEIVEKSDEVLDEMLAAISDSRGALRNIASISERLERGEGTIGRLLADEDAYDELMAAFGDANRVLKDVATLTDGLREGRGLAGRFLTDDELAERFDSAVADVGRFSAVLGEMSDDFRHSSLGRLASDDELYVKLTRTLEGLEDTMSAVSESRGTVGMLVNDPELYLKLNATVDGVQEIINEYREQSPILTFTGAVFGAL